MISASDIWQIPSLRFDNRRICLVNTFFNEKVAKFLKNQYFREHCTIIRLFTALTPKAATTYRKLAKESSPNFLCNLMTMRILRIPLFHGNRIFKNDVCTKIITLIA